MRTTQLSFVVLSASSLVNALAYPPGIYKRAAPPATLPHGYTYKGCYVDVGRTISDATTANGQMSNDACTTYCYNKGFSYAGTEYYNECYCGNALAKDGVLANEADCSTPCSGNATQPCGGPNRLSLYQTSLILGPSVNPGVGDWSSIGCYSEGTTGRALTYGIGSIPGGEMTVAKCTAACANANFILAGVEYSGECFCGSTISNGGAPAVDGCNMLCNGNSSEYCGGPNRLNVYDFQHQYKPLPTSTSTPAPTGASTSSSSTSTSSSTAVSSSSSVISSSSTAVSSSSSVISSSSSAVSSSSSVVSSSSNVVSSSSTVVSSSSSSSSSATPTPTGPSQPATVGVWKWYGCQTEATNARALSAKTTASDDMTLEKCAAFCDGNTFFGVEYSRECWCGNSFAAGSVAAPSSQCSMKCMGNQFQYCGEGNRLSVYTIGSATQSSSSSSSASSSTVSGSVTSAASSTSSTAAPAATGFPTGWTNQGCWVDNLNGRILPNQLQDDPAMTLASCAKACSDAGYTVAGAEYHTQCFCGNAIYNGGAVASDPTSCNTACGGKASEMCGGGNRMTIISKGTPQTYAPPVPQRSGFNGSWTYQGCVQDNVGAQPNPRTFYWQNLFPGTMTAGMCLDRCAEYGYMAAGLEYGEECYCGDPANIVTQKAAFVDDSECNIVCPGNRSSICGGGARLSTYFWTGTTPLYSWNFGTDAASAGVYENLIGGVTIPLMTMETITGKVSFLEKFGTGPPNSTGAYELDLSLVPDISKAWREMHVKTDIFCSAGITLPDKAGRQLNIGGWSGDSTYGVRLYWPDGKPGTPGTNDWQEDVTNLRLQDGRWYPSAMIMANGSIFVIGGEEGSNGRAVPTIELLPSTGTKPLYMDWLARTDPNNLYPFVAVLPSQDIFVAYWNEARILDHVTFNTKTILPNIPGAVNNPKGGRTYPLEGTGVLLPQHAPYTDPLGVLICGGSTEGPATAMDNCVSIEPEGTNPKWVIERMPSRRVMSCIAPLPDGTYLINNGAQHGVAGFGLANDPNLNALLYDPSKKIGQRITVMANTTIARLYHSESITLLDGRVLVSGSDPEDGVNPQEYRVEVFKPPYLTSGKTRPTFTIANTDWTYGQQISVSLGHAPLHGDITVSLLGAVGSTHGNSMGARTLFPAVTCGPTTCTVTAPPNAGIAPPGWYQFFVLDGGIPAVGVYVRIGGDPASLGNWPQVSGFKVPGV
ncbi:WSC domain-containing protein [Colletotrichum paranaense]|uniref:WSC domain-containing protein n=1 Tax=Colletotrichum paranaense TaxID=1914294 RepID=A0ABQ9T170_9PEZI|nr:WSC domain-containing protein [Colletotrichum paranaense]KAK1545521.1 WSC domain-containing protein [Colletotrichum paranaense]